MTQADEYEALIELLTEKAKETERDWFEASRAFDNSEPSINRAVVRAVLAVIAEKAKEWPTARCTVYDERTFAEMLAASPLVKPEPESKKINMEKPSVE